MQSEGQNQATRPLQVVVTLVALVMSLALMVMGVQLYTSLDDKNREALQHASTAFSHVQQQTYSYSRMMIIFSRMMMMLASAGKSEPSGGSADSPSRIKVNLISYNCSYQHNDGDDDDDDDGEDEYDDEHSEC